MSNSIDFLLVISKIQSPIYCRSSLASSAAAARTWITNKLEIKRFWESCAVELVTKLL